VRLPARAAVRARAAPRALAALVACAAAAVLAAAAHSDVHVEPAAAAASAPPATAAPADAPLARFKKFIVAVVDGPAAAALAAELLAADADARQPAFLAAQSQRAAALSAGLIFASLSPAAEAWVRAHPSVLAVEPDATVGARPAAVAVAADDDGAVAASVPSPSAVPWSLDRLDQRALPLNAEYSLSLSDAGAGVDVYVVDSGLRAGHDEFRGRVFLDAGANFSPDARPDDVTDTNGHGTFCASLAAGALVGVAPGATVIPIRIYDSTNSGPLSQALAGLVHARGLIAARAPRRAVVSLSFGGPLSAVLNGQVAALLDAGAVVAVAAGNDARDACAYSPASARGGITAGATDAADALAPFSNTGPCVDVLAPGVAVPGADFKADSGYRLMSGTSMAAPLTAGSAARVLAARPGATPADVKAALLCGATWGVVRGVPAGTRDALLFNPPGGWPAEAPADCALTAASDGAAGGARGGPGRANAAAAAALAALAASAAAWGPAGAAGRA